MILFQIGSSVLLGANPEIEQDSWIALLFSMAGVIPIVLIYARIAELYPDKCIYGICIDIFGKIIGRVMIALFTFYAFHLTAIVLRNFVEFLQITNLTETPHFPIMIAMLLVCIYLLKSGIQTIGKWGMAMAPVVLLFIFFTIITSLNHLNFENILPILDHSPKEFLSVSYSLYTFPFAETVLFLGAFPLLNKGENPYKVYLYAILIGGISLLFIILRNILILGPQFGKAQYFASYNAARIIELGEFFTRIEATISIIYILAGITKITVCLLSATKGIAKMFSADYNKLIIPCGLIVLSLCPLTYENVIDMFAALHYYPYYVLPFQTILPIIIWIGAEIKTPRKANPNESPGNSPPNAQAPASS